MNKQIISRAIGECHEMVTNGISSKDLRMVGAGAFGLEIIGIMLSEPVEMPEIHVIKIDVFEQEKPDHTSEPQPSDGQPKAYICSRCQNEEFTPGAKFCKICGMPVVDLCR